MTAETGQIRINHQCPQCGAPTELKEFDRLFACPYCKVRSYLATGGVHSYVLPHKSHLQQLFYFPYWRFKGVFCSASSEAIESSVIDASAVGVENEFLAPSLGLRTQSLTLCYASADVEGHFIPPTISPLDALKFACERHGGPLQKSEMYQDYVSEWMSLIYQPCYVNGKLFDAVVDKAISPVLSPDYVDKLAPSSPPQQQVEFVPALCPECGWDLTGKSNSSVLVCGNCTSAWGAQNGELVRIEFACLPGNATTTTWLPFWQISARFEGIELTNYADLVRVANLAKLTSADCRERPFFTWVPAFRARPDLLINLARTLTLAQPVGATVEEAPVGTVYPVTRGESEAVAGLKVLMASITRPPTSLMVDWSDVQVEPVEKRLVFLPFEEMASELINRENKIAVQKNAFEAF